MFKVVNWTPDLDITDFYDEAKKRGYHNNDSYESMIKPFEDLEDTKILILYYDNKTVGCSISHPFLDGYRIFTRLCVFTDLTPFRRCGTVKAFKEHQHVTPRFFLPEHAKLNAPLYFTTHPEDTAKMQSMHKLVTSWLSQCEVIEHYDNIEYRGSTQSVWKVNTEKWLDDMNKYPIYYDSLLDNNNIFTFDYPFNKDILLLEMERYRDKFAVYDDPRGKLENWKVLRHEDESLLVAQKECDRFLKDSGIKEKAKPRYYILEANSNLPFHVDYNTTCSINFLLSDEKSPVSFDGVDYNYSCAVLNTTQPHGVNNKSSDRLLYKISFFETKFEEVVEALKNANL
jgi:hypothetical protein